MVSFLQIYKYLVYFGCFLIEKIMHSARIEKEERREREGARGRPISGPLDPLLFKLAQNYSDAADLSSRLHRLFTVCLIDRR